MDASYLMFPKLFVAACADKKAVAMSAGKSKTHSAEMDSAEGANEASGQQAKPSADWVFVIGIGASAGGLEALEKLFRNIPADTYMAYVVVSRRHPGRVSLFPNGELCMRIQARV